MSRKVLVTGNLGDNDPAVVVALSGAGCIVTGPDTEYYPCALDAPLSINSDATPDKRSDRVSFDRLRRALPQLECRQPMRASVRALAASLGAAGPAPTDLGSSRFVRVRRLRELLAAGDLTPQLRWPPQSAGCQPESDDGASSTNRRPPRRA